MQNTTNRLLDEVREEKGIQSDYALAKLLRVQPSAIGNYRAVRSHMRDDLVLVVAKMLGYQPAPLLCQIAGERAKNADVAKAWKDLAKSIAPKGRK